MFKNMKIGKKLILFFILVGIISSIASIIGLVEMTNMNTNYSNALINYGFSQGDVGKFNAEFDVSRAYTQSVLLNTNETKMLNAAAELEKSNKKIDQYLQTMKKTMVNQKEISYYNTIQSEYAKYREVEDKVVTMAKEYNKTAAFELFETDGSPHSDKILAAVNALVALKTTTGDQLSASLSSQGTLAVIFILSIILASLLLSFFIALRISSSISKPVKEMANAAQRMAQGDLSVQVSVNSKDEIGQLSAAFSETIIQIKAYITEIQETLSKMSNGELNVCTALDYKGDFTALKDSINCIASSLNDAFTQIQEASGQVAAGSKQVSDGAQVLSQGATEQASSVQELSASISEISSHVKDNAEHAADALENVNHVSLEIEASNRHMDEMVAAMSQIQESSGEIGKIIKTIEDIAFQTNILALNAAVEAARAGTAGKGFAVVADEVRNLAGKSAQAAKNTTALIDNSIKQIESGTQIADETAKSLLQVVGSAQTVHDTIKKIAQVSRRQSDAIEQVKLGVDQISGVVQTNTATAEESAVASKLLSEQAHTLNNLVGKFQLQE